MINFKTSPKERLLQDLQDSYYTLQLNYELLLKAEEDYIKDELLWDYKFGKKFRNFMKNFSHFHLIQG